MIKYILLGFLNYQKLTGYELKQSLDSSTSHFWHAYHSQIYTTLRQMEKDGLVSSDYIQEEGSPDRRVYTLTPAGRQELAAWLEQPMTEVSPVKEELLVRLFFSARRDPAKVKAELLLQRDLHQKQLNHYTSALQPEISKNACTYPGLERDAAFWQLTLDMGMEYEKMYLAWIDSSLAKLGSL
jgi:DNA-binding PadR family transcriptional regulator